MSGSEVEPVATGPTTIVTDSAACLAIAQIGADRLRIVPLRVVVGDLVADDEQAGLPGWVEEAVRRGDRLTTARPTPDRFAAVYRQAADAGAGAVVSVHVSGRLSGTISSAQAAAANAPMPVRVVDSHSIGTGQGLVVLAAIQAAALGLSADEVAAAAERCAEMTGSFFALDSAKPLLVGGRLTGERLTGERLAGDGAASGRSSGADAPLPAVLAYRPLLRIRDGQITAVDRVRTRLATAERLAELAAEFAGSRVVDVAVQYTAGAVDRAADLADRLTAAITQVHRLYLAEAGAAITAHTGLGMLGVALTPQWPADQAEASGEAPVQEASGETPVQADLPLLIETGLRLVGERLRSSPGFSIYLSIQRQLEYLHETVARGQVPTPEKLDSLTLGVYAAREFETSDPEFADMLFKVNYLANRMS